MGAGFEGGGDLRFKDDFADSITDVDELPDSIHNLLQMGDLSRKEFDDMVIRVLLNPQNADEVAAKKTVL